MANQWDRIDHGKHGWRLIPSCDWHDPVSATIGEVEWYIHCLKEEMKLAEKCLEELKNSPAEIGIG